MTTFEERLQAILVNTYDIERELGGGGMSRVFVAIDKSLGRKVVIKLLSPDLVADVNRGRFRREIQVAAQLQHPHIVPLLSAGEHEDLVWYTMPFIAGESLRSAVEKHGAMSVPDVVRVMYHVGEALDYAHGEGVVHRDIKAANILRSGTYALVTDFGVAKALNASMPAAGMTATGTAIGTPAYMAPEQLAGDPSADHRIDIYALGLLAYELLNGRSPFAATTPAKVLVMVLSEDPKPLADIRPDVPRSLSELVMSCLAKDPDERPATAREMLNALDRFSTASGEIRTMEHKIPKVDRTVDRPVRLPADITGILPASATLPFDTPTSAAPPYATPPRSEQVSIAEPGEATPTGPIDIVEEERPRGNRNKMIIGGLALLIPVIAGAIFLAQRTGGPATVVPPTAITPAPIVVDSAATMMQPPPTAAESVAAAAAPKPVVPKIDSQAIKDSIRKAKAEAAKVAAAAAAKADSLKKADSAKRVQAVKANARRAVSVFLSNASATKTLTDAATHKGGLLGSKRLGDLQTQINALTPFLQQQGLSYEQWKGIVAESGVKIFDEFGRIIPAALQQFAGSH